MTEEEAKAKAASMKDRVMAIVNSRMTLVPPSSPYHPSRLKDPTARLLQQTPSEELTLSGEPVEKGPAGGAEDAIGNVTEGI